MTGVRTIAWWRWLVLAALAAGLPVLLHGCHGDEDNELFAPLVRMVSPSRKRQRRLGQNRR
jgi:hypothetical protein